MAYTKREFVTAAFEEIGLASFVYDLTTGELTAACKRLDAMMAEWNAKGVRLGYPIPTSPSSTNLDDDSGVTDMANEAIILNLAIRIAPGYGKQVSPDTKMAAKQAYNTLLGRLMADSMVEKQLPGTLPKGAGHRTWSDGDPFMPEPADPLLAGPDSELEFI